ncbi:MAG: carbohydrate kinase family protein [Proteobacteria bacterium]|nr:carbohydrate kinase family protein [Pseudomonadota bacterium]
MSNPTQVGGGKIAVTGSLAFDLIMDFPGNFKDHILADKLHVINISFLVGELKKQRGGCAANIAYTLALLGQSPRVVAAAGRDFADYDMWLRSHGVDTSGVTIFDENPTASCHITTDRANNQITGFHPGAMAKAHTISLAQSVDPDCAWVIVAPDAPDAMVRHCREARERGLKIFFDPSFQVTAMDGDRLLESAKGAYALILNDYEFAVFCEKTGRTREQLLAEDVQMIVVTYGEKGSEIHTRDGQHVSVPAARPKAVTDPTGAGDAYRGGFLAGLLQGLPLEVCGRMGSVASAYAIELLGTQNHSYTLEEFDHRYTENFGPRLQTV